MLYPDNLRSKLHKYSVSNVMKHTFVKLIPPSKLKLFHTITQKYLRDSGLIVKGSRALNNKINVYDDISLQYVDYDLYSKNPKKDLLNIAQTLFKNGISEITGENMICKKHIYRLVFYTIPMIDI